MMNQYHSPCSAIATIALLSFCFAAPVRAGYALYSARQIQSEEPLDGGLYTYTGIAIALDVNCHPIGMQQACPPSLLHIQIYPSRMVSVNPAIGFPQAAPFAGNVKLDGTWFRKYQIGDEKIRQIEDSMHDRELRRIERNSPSGASRYGTSPTGTTVTWDPSAAAGTGTLLVPWSGNQGLF